MKRKRIGNRPQTGPTFSLTVGLPTGMTAEEAKERTLSAIARLARVAHNREESDRNGVPPKGEPSA